MLQQQREIETSLSPPEDELDSLPPPDDTLDKDEEIRQLRMQLSQSAARANRAETRLQDIELAVQTANHP